MYNLFWKIITLFRTIDLFKCWKKYHKENLLEFYKIYELQNINKLQTDLASLCVLAQQADLHPNTFKNCKLEKLRKLFQPIHEIYEA